MQEVSFRNTENDIRIELRNRINCLDKEVKFRQDFNAVYPRYLPALRQHCPDLTHTDELIAMLLLLEQNNDEIALTLGVTKASVNKADPSKRCERMISELKLDEKQAVEFRKINGEFLQKAQKEREDVKSARDKQREKMMAIREDRNAQMKKFLTDEQYKLYTEKQQSHKKHHKGNRNR